MNATDRDAVTAVIAALTDARARHDGRYGALFTADATYTTSVGTHYRGRQDIIESHRTPFAKFLKGTRPAGEIVDTRFFGPDTAVITGRGDTYKKSRPNKLGKVQTSTLVREPDGQWRIAAFHNTKHNALMEAISFRFAPGTIPAAER